MERKCKQCGKEFSPQQNRQIFCEKKCSTKYHNSLRRTRDKKHIGEIECLCPGCGENHFRIFNPPWTGRGIPRKYCEDCYRQISTCGCLYSKLITINGEKQRMYYYQPHL